MSQTHNFITAFQRDVFAYLEADCSLQHVTILREAPRDPLVPGSMLFEEQVQQFTAGQTVRNHRCGLALLCFLPTGEPESRAHDGLAVTLEMSLRALEHLPSNASPMGTGMSCEDLILEAMLLLQMWTPSRGRCVQISEFERVPLKDQPDVWAWECLLTLSEAATPGRSKCKMPKITLSGGTTMTLSCPMSAASIYYTLDGSLPTPHGGELYTGPVDIEGSPMIRAAAWLAGMRGSDVAEKAAD